MRSWVERLELGIDRAGGGGTERKVRLDAILERREPKLVQPGDLVLRERLVGEVDERRCRARGRERLS